MDFCVRIRNSCHSGEVHSAASPQTRHSLAFSGIQKILFFLSFGSSSVFLIPLVINKFSIKINSNKIANTQSLIRNIKDSPVPEAGGYSE